jgi:small GTP-binding protein
MKVKRSLNEVKVLLVGDGAVGKTSLLKRLMGEKFNKNEPQPHGINIKSWEVQTGKDRIKAHLWDFGGQEIMHATHQFFLSKRSLYILVLYGRRDEKTEYWLKHIKSFGGDSPVLVVMNKIDENPGFDVNRPFLKEKYQNIKGFFRLSCATTEGIEDFSKYLVHELAKVELLRTTWACNWFNVKTQLENMTDPFISYKQYKRICEEESISDQESQDTLVDFLNDLGVVLHFKDFELLDTYILEPKWVTEAVYKIINSRELAQSKGLLNLKSLDKILEKKPGIDYHYPRDKYRYIIALMKKFELCYGIDDETVLIPELLQVREPHIDFEYETALKFIIHYDFLPCSVLPRFIVNMHRDIKNQLQWRTGVILEDRDFNSTAVVKADHEDGSIYIYVNNGQKRDYFSAILTILRRINKSFEKLKTTELIPMPDDPGITVNYKHLIRLEEEGIELYLPGKSDKKYRVKDLLGTIREPIEEDETLQMLRTIKISQMQRKKESTRQNPGKNNE